MKILRFCPMALALVLTSSLAFGQATRTWVSGVGDDANPCSRTAPCKTFAGAISKTAPGGEIDALDPGGFGALTITKSITLDGGGGQVGLRAVSSAGTVQVSIDESQFTLNGFGVWADSNSKVDVTRSRAAGNSAIGFISQATAAGASTMDVDTSFTVNNGVGLQAGGSVGPSNLFVSRTFVADNATGVVNGGNGTSHGWTPANNPSKDTGSFNGGAQPTI